MGREPAYILLFALIFWNIDKRFGFRLAVLFLFSMSLNDLLKNILHTPRPVGQPGIRSLYLSSAIGYSFPSGHSQAAATFYLYLYLRWREPIIKVLGFFLIIGIGFSRLYLGVHWPGDVLGGYAIGLLMVFLFWHLDKRLLKIPFSLKVKLTLSALVPLLFLVIYHSKQGFEIIGFIIGFTSGYFLEDHFLDYRERTKLKVSVRKTFLGLLILTLWILLMWPLTYNNPWLNLPVFTLAGLWTSCGAPYFFRRFGWEQILEKEISPIRITGGTR